MNDFFFEITKKKDSYEPIPLYVELPIPDKIEPKKEEEKEKRGVIIIELF